MNSPEAVIVALGNAPALVVPLVREVPPAVLKRRPAPGRWSAHEHACHLADVHGLFFERLGQFVSEPRPRIVPFDPATAQEPDALLSMDLDESLARFEADRRRLVERLEGLAPELWQRTAEHDEYAHYSLFIMFRHLALHDSLHAYRIEELLLKKDWGEKGEMMNAE